MNTHTFLPEETIIRRALEALIDTLGPIETARFLALPRQQIPDAVEWHRQWQSTLDSEAFFDDVFVDEADGHETNVS